MSYLSDAQVNKRIRMDVAEAASIAVSRLLYCGQKDFETVCKEHVQVTVPGGRNELFEVALRRLDPGPVPCFCEECGR